MVMHKNAQRAALVGPYTRSFGLAGTLKAPTLTCWPVGSTNQLLAEEAPHCCVQQVCCPS